jgi:hypothetical protein
MWFVRCGRDSENRPQRTSLRRSRYTISGTRASVCTPENVDAVAVGREVRKRDRLKHIQNVVEQLVDVACRRFCE